MFRFGNCSSKNNKENYYNIIKVLMEFLLLLSHYAQVKNVSISYDYHCAQYSEYKNLDLPYK